MIDVIEYSEIQSVAEWMAVLPIALLIVLMPKLFKLNFFNGLITAQLMLFINCIPIVIGLVNGFIPRSLVLQFFFSEFSLMLATFLFYSMVIKVTRNNFDSVIRFFQGRAPYIMIGISVVLAIFVFIVTPRDGDSRILYQTNYWYSAIKPILTLFIPLSFLGVFVLLFCLDRRGIAYILLAANIASGVASGSKGAFVLQSITAILMLRDLGQTANFKLRYFDLAVAAVAMIAAIRVVLDRLYLEVSDITERFLYYAEPTVMTYYASTPTAACSNLTTFAKMHRGWARALGDASAANIDTLFGYAWMIHYIGVNTFTGPNARFGAYLACNFPGPQIFLGFLVAAFYFTLTYILLRLMDSRKTLVPFIFPFLVFSMVNIGQDFNLLMQDLNYLILFCVILLVQRPYNLRLLQRRQKFAMN